MSHIATKLFGLLVLALIAGVSQSAQTVSIGPYAAESYSVSGRCAAPGVAVAAKAVGTVAAPSAGRSATDGSGSAVGGALASPPIPAEPSPFAILVASLGILGFIAGRRIERP
jgi:hypothetical protein